MVPLDARAKLVVLVYAAILFFGEPSVSRLRQIARDSLGLSRKTTLAVHVLTVEGEIDVWATVGRGEAREFYVWTLTGNKLSGPVKSSATTYRRRRAVHAGVAS